MTRLLRLWCATARWCRAACPFSTSWRTVISRPCAITCATKRASCAEAARRRTLMIGKVAIITGATAGIGEATAKRFAREGIRVVLAGRREALGQRLVESIRAEGGEGTFVAADMLSEDDVRRVVDTAVNHYGRL